MRTNPDIWKECIDCKGLCCRWEHVLISEKEIKRIAKSTRKKDFYFKRKGYLFLRKNQIVIVFFIIRKITDVQSIKLNHLIVVYFLLI